MILSFLLVCFWVRPAVAATIEELEKRLQTLESYAFQLRQEIEDFKKSPQPPISSPVASETATNTVAPAAEAPKDEIDSQILVNSQNNLYGRGRQSAAITSLTAKIPANPHRQKLPANQTASSETVSQSSISQQNLTPPVEKSPSELSAPQQNLDTVSAPQNEKLNASIAKVQSGQFTEGEQELKAYVADSQNSDIGRAQYWLGKAYYHQRKYTESAQAYIEGYKLAKDTSLGPDILLNLSLSLVQINEKDDACKVLSTVAQRYPNEKIKIGMAEEEKKRLNCS